MSAYSQAIPHWLTIVSLAIDLIGVFINLCVLIGVYRAFKRNQSHLIQHCSKVQIISTLSISAFVIVGKTELVSRNWSTGYLYTDRSDIAVIDSPFAEVFCSSLLVLTMIPIYTAVFLQILTVSLLLQPKDCWLRNLAINRPDVFFGCSYVPGFVMLACYWIEMYARDIKRPYSLKGLIIAPYNYSYVVYACYFGSLVITLTALYFSLRSLSMIKENIINSIALMQTAGIPGYLVFHVLYLGYSLPFIGISKLPGILVWLFPSFLNQPFVYFSMLSAALNPFMTFYGVGSNKNIGPHVPYFAELLEREYHKQNKLPKFILDATDVSDIESRTSEASF